MRQRPRIEQQAGLGDAQRLRQGGADPRERVAGSLGQLCIGLGLTLFLVTLMLNIIAHRIVQTYREQYD